MVLGIIPARYGSSRFPGKPLAEINGKSMIQRVYEQATKAKKPAKIIVATDDDRIAEHVRSFGGEVILTMPHHPSGTDRCYEAFTKVVGNYTYVLNIQGDEPFLDPQQIDEIASACNGETELITQMTPVDSHDILFDSGEVKIVLNEQNEALYFSRQVIPHIKGIEEKEWHKHFNYFRHVGMYAYRIDVLEQLTKLMPSSLEKAESLEQLRWLQAGFKIKCIQTTYDSHCIDTPEDINKVLTLLSNKKK